MSGRGSSSHPITGVFVFLILGMFGIFSTVMVLMGAKAYRGTVERAEAHNSTRIASSYIRSMLRADDEAGALRIEDLDGITAVSLLNTYDDESYITRIYVYDGSLRELFTEADIPFDPSWGEAICAADSLQAEIQDGLLSVRLSVNGSEDEILYAPRAEMTEGR